MPICLYFKSVFNMLLKYFIMLCYYPKLAIYILQAISSKCVNSERDAACWERCMRWCWCRGWVGDNSKMQESPTRCRWLGRSVIEWQSELIPGCSTIPIWAGQSQFGGQSPKSWLDPEWDVILYLLIVPTWSLCKIWGIFLKLSPILIEQTQNNCINHENNAQIAPEWVILYLPHW
jgi:hypothetical protein